MAFFMYREICLLFQNHYLPLNIDAVAPADIASTVVADFFSSPYMPWFNAYPLVFYNERNALMGAPYITLVDRHIMGITFDATSYKESPMNGTYLLLVVLMVHDIGHVARAQLVPAEEDAPRAFKCPAHLPGDDPGVIMERSFFGGAMSVVCRDGVDVQHLKKGDILYFIMTRADCQRYRIDHDVARRWISECEYKPFPPHWLSPAGGKMPLPNEYPCSIFNNSVYSSDRFQFHCPSNSPP